MIEFDAGEILRDFTEEIHTLNQKTILGAVLGETCGFEQKDGTFALYVTQYEKLKSLTEKNFTQVPEWYWEMVSKQAADMFAKFVEKYFERSADRFGNKLENQ